jgi:hypothetical protein
MERCAEVRRAKAEAVGAGASMQTHDRLRVRDQEFG